MIYNKVARCAALPAIYLSLLRNHKLPQPPFYTLSHRLEILSQFITVKIAHAKLSLRQTD
jgi:hypothetical protein